LDRDVSRIAKLLADWYPKEFSEDPTGKAQAITTRSTGTDDLPVV